MEITIKDTGKGKCIAGIIFNEEECTILREIGAWPNAIIDLGKLKGWHHPNSVSLANFTNTLWDYFKSYIPDTEMTL